MQRDKFEGKLKIEWVISHQINWSGLIPCISSLFSPYLPLVLLFYVFFLPLPLIFFPILPLPCPFGRKEIMVKDDFLICLVYDNSGQAIVI